MSDRKFSATPLGWFLIMLAVLLMTGLCFSGCTAATIAKPGVEDVCVHKTGHKCYDGRSCISSDEERAAYKKCL